MALTAAARNHTQLQASANRIDEWVLTILDSV
jgi:hypothetical protein